MTSVGGFKLKRPITEELRRSVIEDLSPEIEQIRDPELRRKAVEAWAMSLASSSYARLADVPGWGDVDNFYLKRGNQPTHLRGVARMAMMIVDDFNKQFPDVVVDRDLVVCGALCHDLGKTYEFDPVNQKRWKADPTRVGDPTFRHSVFGVHIALSAGLPEEIAHICLGHSREGVFISLSTECNIVREADHLWWTVACSLGMLQPDSIASAGPKMRPRRLRSEMGLAAE
ncbi:MAG: HD domain-containing protein [Alphaproteobacteria bacterium]|nr:HD domain-containing protein [Alphaproteobacteria bacterium]